MLAFLHDFYWEKLEVFAMKSILLQITFIMMLWIKIEVTDNNIHEIFKIKAI